ncbi:phosphatidylinositol phosphatase PTPRQ-like [Panulirus ornatus]|uniref:phosphatidylinositol phosphatase PTPRQ-like n=1 Tax=Panulirus ornatus TaxID=150431 RepID=UPI003A859496
MLCVRIWTLVSLLMLGPLLLSAAEDHETQQRENKASDNCIDGLGPPENVTVESTPHSLYVSWDPPAEEPNYYTVTWAATEEDVTYETFYVVDGLEPCKTHQLSVTSVYSNAKCESSLIRSTTNATVPPEPGKCSFSEVYSNALEVEWGSPETSCHIQNYSISWLWDILWMDSQDSGESYTTRLYFTLTALPPYANVTVEVAAATEVGFGPSTACWQVTSADEPGAPDIENVTPYEGSASVTWSPPEEANGIITEYEVVFEDKDGTYVNTTVDGDVQTTLVEDLEPCESYDVSVKARTEAGWGPFSDTWSTTITGNVPVDEVNCDTDHLNVKVCWESSSTKCPASVYNVTWVASVLWTNETLSGNDQVPWKDEEMCLVIEDSVPLTIYTICVSVDDHAEEGKCCSQLSPEGVPGPPLLQELQTEERTIIVSWRDPVDKNGIIDVYVITWYDSTGASDENYEGIGTYTNTIYGLAACETYSVVVKAHTSGGFGNDSNTEIAVTDNYIAESSIACDGQESREAEVAWSLASQDCPVTEFIILWNTKVLWTDDNGNYSETVPGNATTSVLSNLEPYTQVDVCISIVGRKSSVCCFTITQEEVPSKPTELQLVNTTTTTATVSWSLPEHLNGVLYRWHLTWSWRNESAIETDLGASQMQYTIVNLLPGTTYYIRLRARTGAGLGDSATIDITTGKTSSYRIGTIVGASVGLLVLVAAVGCGVYFYRKRSRTKAPSLVSDMELEATEARDTHDTYSSEL